MKMDVYYSILCQIILRQKDSPGVKKGHRPFHYFNKPMNEHMD